MGIIKKLCIGFICLSLTACSNQSTKDSTELSNDLSYSIKSSKILDKYVRSDGSIAYANFEIPKAKKEDNDFSIIISRQNILCDNQIMGTDDTHLNINSNGSASWGLVTAWDQMDLPGFDWTTVENVVCKPEGTPKPQAVYALCAEKNGKTVMVCINQMTDNPKQAKEIFETFRWRK